MEGLKEYMTELGAKGGKSRSSAKLAAVRENVKKALAAREAKRASNRHTDNNLSNSGASDVCGSDESGSHHKAGSLAVEYAGARRDDATELQTQVGGTIVKSLAGLNAEPAPIERTVEYGE